MNFDATPRVVRLPGAPIEAKRRIIFATRIAPSMSLTKIALYRASLLADNLGIRLCLAALLVMPSALMFLMPVLALFGVEDELLPVGGGSLSGLLALALGVGFAAAWARIVLPGARLSRQSGLRLFVTAGLALGVLALAIELTTLLAARAGDDAAWLLLPALGVLSFLLASAIGQPRTDRLHRI